MRLTDLDPKLVGTLDNGILRFRCPFPGHTHAIRVFVSRERAGPRVAPLELCPCGEPHKYWQATGEYPDSLTLSPSIDGNTADTPCWHGHVENGVVK